MIVIYFDQNKSCVAVKSPDQLDVDIVISKSYFLNL